MVYDNYVYIEPTKIRDKNESTTNINRIFEYYGYKDLKSHIRSQMNPKENTYVKIASGLHPSIAAEIIEIKDQYKEGYRKCFSEYLTQTPFSESCTQHR
jgi:hypothetical protein